MKEFTWNDQARVRADAPAEYRRGEEVYVVGLIDNESWAAFPPGTIYTIEYEDGSMIQVHASHLEPLD